jgi:hypothetical protein
LKPGGVRMLNFESSSSRLMSMISLICNGMTPLFYVLAAG